MTKLKVAGTRRVPLPETGVIFETGYGTWNVPAFATCVRVATVTRQR
jgi:hypothetical protein